MALVLALLSLLGSVLAAEAFAGEAGPASETGPTAGVGATSGPQLSQAGYQGALSAQGDPPTEPGTDPQVAEELPHEELGREGAEELLTGVFGEVIEAAGTAPGEEADITGYDSDHVAVVEEPLQERSGLLESLLPLRAEDEQGNQAPVNLELTPQAGELAPANPLTEVGIPGHLGEGIELPGAGIGVKLVGAPEETAPSLAAPSTAFYPNVAPDTDLAVSPTATGVETLTQIRSAEAPRTETFELSLPEGASLEDDGEGGARVSEGGQTLLSVVAPTATDASGAAVPVTLGVEGDSYTVQVEPGPGVAYPILVDPELESWYWELNHSTEGTTDWHQWSNSPKFETNPLSRYYEPGMNVYSNYGPAETWAAAGWNYFVPRFYSDQEAGKGLPTSYIEWARLQDLRWWFEEPEPYAENPFLVFGLWNFTTATWAQIETHGGSGGQLLNPSNQYFKQDAGASPEGTKEATVYLQTSEGFSRARHLLVGQAEIMINDNDSPTFAGVAGPAQWVNNVATSPIVYRAEDTGLGVYEVTLRQPSGNGVYRTFDASVGCFGNWSHPCPRAVDQTTLPPTYAPSTMPTGEDKVFLRAQDPVHHWSGEAQATVKVDHIPPTLTVSGTATEQAKVGTGLPTYSVKVHAADGTTNAPQSGVARTVIKVDGTVVHEAGTGCATKNCEVTDEWQLESSRYTTRTHTIEVTAYDAVGLPSEPKKWTIELSPEPPQPGPIAAYPLDEGEGTIAHDATGDGHEGTLSAEGVSWAPGRYGDSLKFDGAKGCVTVPDSPALQLREEFTLEAWVRPEGELLHLPAITKQSEGFPAYVLGVGMTTAGKAEGQIGTQAKGTSSVASTASLEANVWQHEALTYDGANLRLYVNGQLVATKAVEKTNSGALGPLEIGCSSSGHFRGRIDEVRVYNRVLGAGEVSADRLAPIQTARRGPVAAYAFDEGTGTTAQDITGNGHTATIEGATWAPGRYGSGLEFTSSAHSVVKIPASPEFSFSEEFTLEAWVRPSSSTNTLAPVIGKTTGGGSGNKTFSYYLYGGDQESKPFGEIEHVLGSGRRATAPTALSAGTWSHIALTYDGGIERLYVNGAEVSETTSEPPVDTSGELQIGAETEHGDYFNGRIDEVRIYNRALEASEVAADRLEPIQTPQAGPVAAWSFDEGSGTTARDVTGNGHEATLSTEGVSWAPGRYGSSLRFDGSKGCVSVPYSTAFQLGEQFSLEAWVRPEGELNHLPIVFQAAEAFPAYDLGIGLTTAGRGEGQIGTLAKSHTDVATPAAMEDNVWQHLAVTFDGAKLRLYLNGELVTTKTVTEPNSGVPGSLRIGCTESLHFNGRIDEVRIYNRALEASEVAADRLEPIQTPQAGPVAAWSFDEGSGTTARDVTGNGHEATLSTEGVSWAPGRYGSSLRFDGSKGCVSVPYSTAFQLGEQFSLEAWVRPEGELNHLPIVFQAAEAFPAYDLGIGLTTAGRGEGQIGTLAKSHTDVATPAAMEDNVWQHLAVTFDGAKLRLYLNGELVTTKTVTEPNSGVPGSLRIGCTESLHFNGRIDEVRIYNRALEAWEVASDVETPLSSPKTGPVVAYPFDEGEGSVAHDVAGGNHDATLSAEGVSWAPGRYGYSLKFDGTKGCVTVPDSPALRLNEEFTLAAWVRPEGELLHLPVITKQAEGFPAYALGVGLNTTGKAEGEIGTEAKGHSDLASPASLEANVWSHEALTFDGSKLRLYVNGELVATKAVEKTNSAASGALDIGCSSSYHFRGRIDEVRVYSRALPKSEIPGSGTPLPTAQVQEASGIGPTEAVFSALVNPMGEEDTVRFEYGPTSAYGQSYPEPTEEPEEGVQGEEPQEVEQGIDELEPEKLYHYRAVIRSPRGLYFSADKVMFTGKSRGALKEKELREAREKLPSSRSWNGWVGMNWSGNLQKTYKEGAQTQLIQESGAKLYRVVIGERSPGAHEDDQIFEEAARRHLTILPDVVGIPNGNGNLLEPIPVNSPARKEWVRELHELLLRYGPEGTFWNEHSKYVHPGLPESKQLDPSLAPEDWEIWNEENFAKQGEEVPNPKNPGHEKIVINPELYGELLEVSHQAITAVDNEAKVVFGGLLTVGRKGPEPHMPVGEFLRRASKGHEGAYDILSLHPYAFQGVKNNASEAEKQKVVHNITRKVKTNIQTAREALKRTGGGEGKKIWITELGWPVKDTVGGTVYAEEDGTHRLVPEDVQSRLLRSTFTVIKEFSGSAEGSYNLGRVLWYNIQDNYIGEKEHKWDSHCGLVQDASNNVPGEEGDKRPAWSAFQAEAE